MGEAMNIRRRGQHTYHAMIKVDSGMDMQMQLPPSDV
jgi:hypothetical protein